MDVLHVRAALAAELPSGAEPPREILLVPAGEIRMRPHDGREPFHNPDPAAVVAASRELRLDLPIDYEHQMDRSKENGRPAPAAGWIKQLFDRSGAVWGEVEWTERATAMIAAKEYRFISPVFLHDKSRTVRAVLGAALTNDPAMFMQALAGASASTTEGRMDPKELRAALGLSAEATDEQVLAAAKAATATAAGLKAIATAVGLAETATAAEVETKVKATASAGAPDPEKFVPREEYDRAAARLTTLETERAEEKATAAVHGAVRAGKIAPSQREWALDYAKSSPDGFKTYVEKAPAIVEPGRVMPAGGGQRAGASASIALPGGRRVDDDRLALHERAQARAAKENIPYVEAVAKEEAAA